MHPYSEQKALVSGIWSDLDARLPVNAEVLAEKFSDHVTWQVADPIGTLEGIESFLDVFWRPLRASVEGFQRQTHILMAGSSNGRADGTGAEGDWVAGTGYFTGRMTEDFLGIPASGKNIRIRWGEFSRVENGRIANVQFMIDLVDWCEQVGVMLLPKSRGIPFVYPAPTAVEGTGFSDPDAIETAKTLKLGRRLIFGGLNVYDEEDLGSMGMRRFFHPNLKWYGPGGINACFSLQEFEELHQQPWLAAFPDRKVQDLESLFADGPFLAASGLSGVHATHSGPYLGHAPQGRRLEVSGLDFWLRTNHRFTENWVFVDMVRLFDQMGYDILSRLR